MVIAAKNAGIKDLIVPIENIKEASLVHGVNIFGFDSLIEVVEFLENRREYHPEETLATDYEEDIYKLDFKEVQGQDSLIEYVVVAASGGHNRLMIGAPGCGKSMIAKRIPTILPSMTDEEALEVTKIYSVSGILREKGGLIVDRPFRAPHHNASTNSLIGGGNDATPGEISPAHNGVLFLDEIAEFNKKTLESLRQPMEDQKVTISRVKHTNTYPASFMLIAAMNPCPCGYYGNEKCKCTDYEVLKYRQKISGPIMDRMDIQKYVRPVDFMDLSSYSFSKTSKELRERVELAREIQKKRFKNVDKVNCNAQMSNTLIKEHCLMEAEGQRLLELAYDRFKYSARTFHKYLKVARTFADIAKEYAGSPTLLYYRGIIKENIEGIGIVGARRCSNYGKQIALDASEFLAKNNIPVISRMAKGIDGYAHTACLKSGGYTIAFLGHGVDICYPSEHRELMEAIIANGAVISEYCPGTRARSEFFPKRNALISSWSRKILVVEAAERSGALITANLAKELGREVLVPPHEIYSSTGKGTNELISHGASIYLHPSQLMFKNESILAEDKESVELCRTKNKEVDHGMFRNKEELLPIEEKIISCIMGTAKTLEEIGNEIKINHVELIGYISIMELEDKIRVIAGGRYVANCVSDRLLN